MRVRSRDDASGKIAWKRVEAQYSNPYPETVFVTVRAHGSGRAQTIVSNRIHPYFVKTARSVASSPGHVHRGVADGRWVDAANLRAGDRLLQDDGAWARVARVRIEHKPLIAYNLTVADFHTYFVAANDNAAPVWVHNACDPATPNWRTGKDYEDHVAQTMNVLAENRNFRAQGRDIDGKLYESGSEIWYEAKSGWDWLSSENGLEKFLSTVGQNQSNALKAGAKFVIVAPTAPPSNVAKWLASRSIDVRIVK